ncbi:MAG TPA: tripartite tricarboxylate transporter substrate binding protein BugD [Burkholderiales bacterium]|jgi:tripartite-type tricarboxylate transporter receptor subunit TctC|nr:tripartite tricarboxylate transporter substrate binding protein BugD [Burkholderiales bacterium]
MKRIGAALLFFLASGAALAQDYPAKPVVIIVPAAAGGPTDTLTRVLAGSMGEALKQQMIVENAGGAGGTIGVTKAAKARADGYTLLLYHIGMATAPTLYRKLQYDTLNDFDYVGQVADVPMMLIAKKATPAANFAEFLAYAKANKDKVSYANAGVGSASYLCGLLFMSAVQTDFTQVPYKGTGPAMNDLVGGQVDFMCDQTTNTVPQIKSGNVKAYGVTTASRIASFPNLPTLDEQGLKGFDLVVWNGLFAPKGIPKPALDKLVAALQTAVQSKAFRARLADLGAEPVPPSKATPGSLGTLLKAEVEKWAPIIRKSGVYAD